MDARRYDIGIAIREPFSGSSKLGNVVYVDAQGILRTITNMFNGYKTNSLELPEPEIHEETVQEIVTMSTGGVTLQRIDLSEHERFSRFGPCVAHVRSVVFAGPFMPPLALPPLRGYKIQPEPNYSGPAE